jgi:hypothetical protein
MIFFLFRTVIDGFFDICLAFSARQEIEGVRVMFILL